MSTIIANIRFLYVNMETKEIKKNNSPQLFLILAIVIIYLRYDYNRN